MKTESGSHLARQILNSDAFDNCQSRDVPVAITSKWSVLILVALEGGTMRFADLRMRVNGVSERMLAERRSFPVLPPHGEYALTPLGLAAALHLAQLTDWIETNLTSPVDAA